MMKLNIKRFDDNTIVNTSEAQIQATRQNITNLEQDLMNVLEMLKQKLLASDTNAVWFQKYKENFEAMYQNMLVSKIQPAINTLEKDLDVIANTVRESNLG